MPGETITEKALPYSIEAERSVLGAVLLDERIFNQAAVLLQEDDFFLESHRLIYRRMHQLASDSRAIDFVTLKEELQKSGKLEQAGGSAYISSLVDGLPRLENIEHYSQIVKEKSALRKLYSLCSKVMNNCLAAEKDPTDILEETEREIFSIAQQQMHTGFVPIQDLLKGTLQSVEDQYRRRQPVTGVETGFTRFDELTAGLQKSNLIIVAARPGLGKTSWCLNVAQHAALKGAKTVGIFSLEMSSRELMLRMLCSEARVDSHRMRTGFLSKEDLGKISKAVGELSQARMFIDDTSSISIIELRSKARRLKAEHGLDLIVLDYLQLMTGRDKDRYENRNQEVSAISRALKGLAKELDIPVVAVSQLSRAPEQRRGDHRPQLSDLRESGSIEQDADLVAFIYREDLFNPTEENLGLAEMIIAKQRNGPPGSFKMACLDQFTRFENAWEE
jgi:replicative DNA helicase